MNGRDMPVDEIRTALRQGRTFDDKFLLVLTVSNRVAGRIDIIRGYPEPAT